jgi:hypothetical protein
MPISKVAEATMYRDRVTESLGFDVIVTSRYFSIIKNAFRCHYVKY